MKDKIRHLLDNKRRFGVSNEELACEILDLFSVNCEHPFNCVVIGNDILNKCTRCGKEF